MGCFFQQGPIYIVLKIWKSCHTGVIQTSQDQSEIYK